MIGGHLITVPLRAGHKNLRLPRGVLAAHGHIARQHEPVENASAVELLTSPAHELIHIAVIVGKQDPALNMTPVASRIVDKPS